MLRFDWDDRVVVDDEDDSVNDDSSSIAMVIMMIQMDLTAQLPVNCALPKSSQKTSNFRQRDQLQSKWDEDET